MTNQIQGYKDDKPNTVWRHDCDLRSLTLGTEKRERKTPRKKLSRPPTIIVKAAYTTHATQNNLHN